MIVKTLDGTSLIVFLKDGMTIGHSWDECDQDRKQSEDAATEVIRCDPNKPKPDNRVEAIERKRALLKLQGLKLIRKVRSHFLANNSMQLTNLSFLAFLLPGAGRPFGPEFIHTDARNRKKSQEHFNVW